MQGRELWYVAGPAIAGSAIVDSVPVGRWILEKNTALNRRLEAAAYKQLYLPDDAAHRAPPFRVRPARWNRSVKSRRDNGTVCRSYESSSIFN